MNRSERRMLDFSKPKKLVFVMFVHLFYLFIFTPYALSPPAIQVERSALREPALGVFQKHRFKLKLVDISHFFRVLVCIIFFHLELFYETLNSFLIRISIMFIHIPLLSIGHVRD